MNKLLVSKELLRKFAKKNQLIGQLEGLRLVQPCLSPVVYKRITNGIQKERIALTEEKRAAVQTITVVIAE